MSPNPLRILVVHNPVAGRWRRARLQKLLSLLESRGHSVSIKLTQQRGDAREAARTVLDVDILVAAGGDGTVNEIVSGLCARIDGEALPAIAFLPLGTANVLAWELVLPRNPQGLADLIDGGKTLATRPGNANGQVFFLMASAGLDARAVAAVRGSEKRWLGAAAYVLAALRTIAAPSPEYTVTIDGRTERAYTVIVTRSRHYGGPFVLTPNAGLGTDQLHAVLLPSRGFWAVLKYGVALAFGRLHKRHDVIVASGERVAVTGPDDEPVQLDGDAATHLPLSVTLESRQVRFLVP